MNKKERLQLICELVNQYQIDTQEEIVSRLQEAGITATQATVSRDIKVLGIVKVPTADNSYVYGLPKSKNRRQRQSPTYLKNAVSQGSMIHLDVEPGSTAVVKRQILTHFSPKIFSIISDDDSLLIIVKTGVDVSKFLQELREW